MPRPSTRHTRRRSSYRTKDDRSSHTLVNQLHKRSSVNREYIKGLHEACEREIDHLGNPTDTYVVHTSNKRARLRQLLIAMTAGNAPASLFVNPQSGKLQAPEAIYERVFELAKPYRLESSRWWAMFRQFGQTVEWLTMRLTGAALMSAGVIELACVLWVGYNVGAIVGAFVWPTAASVQTGGIGAALATRITTGLAFVRAHADLKSIDTIFTAGTASFLALRHYSGVQSGPRAIHNLVVGYNTYRIGKIEEELLADGVGDATRAGMHRVVRDHEALDLRVQDCTCTSASSYSGSSYRIHTRRHSSHSKRNRTTHQANPRIDTFTKLLDEYRNLHTGRFGVLYRKVFGATRDMKIVDLFDARQHDARTSDNVRQFRKEMVGLLGDRFKGYHVFKSSGDARSSVQNIIAAFIYYEIRVLRKKMG